MLNQGLLGFFGSNRINSIPNTKLLNANTKPVRAAYALTAGEPVLVNTSNPAIGFTPANASLSAGAYTEIGASGLCPSIDYMGSTKQYFAAWVSGSGTQLNVQKYGLDLVPVGAPLTLAVTSSSSVRIACSPVAAEFVLFWADSGTTKFRRYSPDFTLQGSQTTVVSSIFFASDLKYLPNGRFITASVSTQNNNQYPTWAVFSSTGTLLNTLTPNSTGDRSTGRATIAPNLVTNNFMLKWDGGTGVSGFAIYDFSNVALYTSSGTYGYTTVNGGYAVASPTTGNYTVINGANIEVFSPTGRTLTPAGATAWAATGVGAYLNVFCFPVNSIYAGDVGITYYDSTNAVSKFVILKGSGSSFVDVRYTAVTYYSGVSSIQSSTPIANTPSGNILLAYTTNTYSTNASVRIVELGAFPPTTGTYYIAGLAQQNAIAGASVITTTGSAGNPAGLPYGSVALSPVNAYNSSNTVVNIYGKTFTVLPSGAVSCY